MQSCTIFIPATYTDSLKAFADAFGFHGKSEKEIVQYLTTCPVEDILKLQTTIELVKKYFLFLALYKNTQQRLFSVLFFYPVFFSLWTDLSQISGIVVN